MLNITVLCVGKLKESFYIAAVREYEKRLKGYCKLTLLELPEEKLPNAPSQAQINAALEKEAQAIFSKLPKRATLVALCIEEVPAVGHLWRLRHRPGHRQLLRPAPVGETAGRPAPVHVPHDLPPSPGAGDAAGAGISGV